jgi:putative copper resistance protein D
VLEALESGWVLALVRAIHFASCLLAFGVVAFDLWIAAPALKDRQAPVAIGWARTVTKIVWSSLLVALLSGLGWLMLNAINMSGMPPREALQSDVLRVVLSETHFGRLWETRSLLWLATLTAVLLRGFLHLRGAMTWIAAFLAGALAASLAWAGHGQDGNRPEWHLSADALHILVGGIWPIGLIPFTILFLKLRRSPEGGKWIAIGRLTRRFSTTSLLSVALLAGTGLVNSFYMLDSPRDLVSSDYGKVLLAKIIVFLAMVGFGAVNLLRWKPRLSSEFNDTTPAAAARLQLNVAVEATLSLAVLILAGFLGTLSPPMDAMMMRGHHHHHSTSE